MVLSYKKEAQGQLYLNLLLYNVSYIYLTTRHRCFNFH